LRLDLALAALLFTGVFFAGALLYGFLVGFAGGHTTVGFDRYDVTGLEYPLLGFVGVLELAAFFNGRAGRRYRLVLAAGLALMGLSGLGLILTGQPSGFLSAALLTEFIYSSRESFGD
jgi:hypothetical protein